MHTQRSPAGSGEGKEEGGGGRGRVGEVGSGVREGQGEGVGGRGVQGGVPLNTVLPDRRRRPFATRFEALG